MEIDGEKFKNIVIHFMNNLKSLETEILALHAVLQTNGLLDVLAEQVQALKSAPQVKGIMDAKYAPFFEALNQQVTQAEQDQAILKLLAQWKPEGEPN